MNYVDYNDAETTNSTAVWAIDRTQWRSRGGEQVGTRIAVRSLSGRSNTLTVIQPFKNAVLSRNLDQNMPKNSYFWRKSCKSRSVGRSAPELPLASGGGGLRPQTSSHYYFRLLL